MSTVIIAVIVNLLAQVLPYFGVDIGPDQIEETVQVLIAIGTGLYIWYQRTLLRKVGSNEESDVNLAGVKK